MISFFAFSGLLNFIVSILLAVLVYSKGKRIFANKIFALNAFSVAFWSFGYFFWQISTEETSALFWSRFLMAGAVFIPIFYFHFIVSFLNLIEKYKRILWGGYGLSVFFFIVNFTPYFVRNVEPELFLPFWPKPGIFFHSFLLMFFSFVVYGWYLLLKSLGGTKETIRKQQIKYLLLGTGIGFICGSTNYFLWYGIPLPPYLNILVSIYVVLTALAILKYHLFEIRVILTEILVGLMGVLLLTFSFLLPEGYKILGFGIFLLFCIFAYYLIRATHEESRRREEAEKLAVQERTLRQRAEKLTKEVEKLAAAKDQFLLSIQHHLRTPLTPVRGYLEMILGGAYGREQNPKIKAKLEAAKKAADTLHDLMEDLLDVQQMRLGKKILNLEPSRIENLVEETIEELKPQADERNLNVVYKKEPLPEIKIDRKRVREAIWNLLDNAIKYTNKGKIEVFLERRENSILLKVFDTGIGMEKEEINYFLVGKFFERGEEAKKLWGPGRGIGLLISKEFVEAHQGKIWAESEGRGKGTKIYVKLPIK